MYEKFNIKSLLSMLNYLLFNFKINRADDRFRSVT
jgi:hypothetical protein